MQDGKMRDRVDIGGIQVYCRYDEAVDIDRITGHPRNPNKHGDEQIALLAKIIKTSGWRNPVCVSNRSGFVIKGHGRLMAARVLGVSHVPVEYQDYESEAAEYQDMIADNRIAELAERDMSIIKDLLEELDTGANDMDLTGYDHAAIEDLMTQTAPPEKIETLSPIRKLHVLITMNANAGLEMLHALEALAEKHSAEIHHGGN